MTAPLTPNRPQPPALNRRRWLAWGLAGLSTAALPLAGWGDDDGDGSSSTPVNWALAETGLNARVVVVGGGMAGATAAKYLRLWGGAGVAVTLVTPETAYTSHIMSNLVLTGQRTVDSLQYRHDRLASAYGVQVRTGTVTAVDGAARTVRLADGSVLPYDRLVLAPGVEFEAAYGLSLDDYDARTPHAWRAGPQTTLLHSQLAALPAGGTFVMSIPKAPYRCPPGPYERACLVADHLKSRYGSNARVLVLDANASIQAERETFTAAFTQVHAGVIDYRTDVQNLQIDATRRRVRWADLTGSTQEVVADVVNPIAPHRATGSGAGGWLAAAGLANSSDGRWAVVDVLSYESTAVPGVHVVGDAAQTGLPKAGHVANQEAKICADAILRLLAGRSPDPAPVANSACYSPITAGTASWLTAVYQYDPTTRSMKLAADNGSLATGRAIESDSISSRNYQQMGGWFSALMGDSFA